jgi:uncharacterized membrane protein YdjX (TVP38/TMEM64 family)
MPERRTGAEIFLARSGAGPRPAWRWGRWAVLAAVGLVPAWIALIDRGGPLLCVFLDERRVPLRGFVEHDFWAAVALFFLLDAAVAALSLPGAALFAMAGGAIFGRWLGTGVVCLASTTGATAAFLASRHLFRPFVERRWGHWLEPIRGGIERDGPYYLLAVQLVPVFPFFLVNAAMGLTRMRPRTFWLTSQIGILPGAFLYVNAGTVLGRVASAGDVLSPAVIGSLLLLGLAPLLARKALRWFRPGWPDSPQAALPSAVRLSGAESSAEKRAA